VKYMMAVLALSAILSGCADNRTTCYGIEPDGEVETLRPCPTGWKNNETRIIKEDEFKSLEQPDNSSGSKKMKPKTR